MRVPPPIILRIFAVVLHPKEILKERNSTQMRVDWASLFIVETSARGDAGGKGGVSLFRTAGRPAQRRADRTGIAPRLRRARRSARHLRRGAA